MRPLTVIWVLSGLHSPGQLDPESGGVPEHEGAVVGRRRRILPSVLCCDPARSPPEISQEHPQHLLLISHLLFSHSFMSITSKASFLELLDCHRDKHFKNMSLFFWHHHLLFGSLSHSWPGNDLLPLAPFPPPSFHRSILTMRPPRTAIPLYYVPSPQSHLWCRGRKPALFILLLLLLLPFSPAYVQRPWFLYTVEVSFSADFPSLVYCMCQEDFFC